MKAKRLLSLVLAICMIVSILPANVFGLEVEAEEETADMLPLSDAAATGETDDGYPVLTLNEVTTAVIPEGEEYAYFSFVPEETDYYYLTSSSSSDTYGYLYDSEMNQITSNDDSGIDYNFEIKYLLQAGTTYYFGVRFYGSYSGSFNVILRKSGALEQNATDSVTAIARTHTYINLTAENEGYYIVRVNSTDVGVEFSGSGRYYGVYTGKNGYSYHRVYLYSGNTFQLMLNNYSEEDAQISLLMKPAETPTSISILGQEYGFSGAVTGYYTLYFGSGWAFAPVYWSLEGNGYIYSSNSYQARCYLFDVGTLTLTATAQDESLALSDSIEIEIIGSIELTVGEDIEITLPYDTQIPFSFTPEESGLYTLTFGENATNIDKSLYQVAEDGNEYSLYRRYNTYYLEAGYTYKLYVTNYSSDLTTTLRIAAPEALTVGGEAHSVDSNTYSKVFMLSAEEDGWYNVNADQSCGIYMYLYDGGWNFVGTSGSYTDENGAYIRYRQIWMEADTQYLVYVENYNGYSLSITAVESPEPTSFYVSYGNGVISVGSEQYCGVEVTPWYAKDGFTVEILSGDAEVTSQGGDYFYVKSNSAGTVEVKVTLDCGLEYTFSLEVVDPVDVVPNSTTSVTVPQSGQAYAELKVEEDGYYVVRINTTDAEMNFSGAGSYYGTYVGKNGYTYYRYYLYSSNAMTLDFANYTEGDIQISLLMKPAETPTSISILGQEYGFSGALTGYYTLYFGSGWAFTPVYWSVEGNGNINSSNSYQARCYLNDVGTLTLTATAQDESLALSDSIEIGIVDSIELAVGVDNEVTLPYNSQVRYTFTPEESGAYTITFGAEANNVNISCYLYQVDADGNETRIYSNGGVFALTADSTYKLYVTNYSAETATTLKVALLSGDVLELGVQTEAVVPSGASAWFSYVPEESGYYYFESYADADTYGYLYDSMMNQLTANDDGGENRNFFIRYYLEAGKQYYFAARYYNSSTSGSYDVMLNLCAKPTSIGVSLSSYTVMVGEMFYIIPHFYPDNSGDAFTVTSSDESVLKFSYQEEGYCYFEALSKGTVTVTVETAGGLTQSVDISVVQPVDVELDTTASATAPAGGAAYYDLTVEEDGYYIVRFKTRGYNLAGGYYGCGSIVNEENGYTYVRMYAYANSSIILTLYNYNNTEEAVRCHVMMKKAQTPTSISIVGQELGFSDSRTPVYTIDYGSVWAYTPVSWTVVGNATLYSLWDYQAALYLEDTGTVTLTATSTLDDTLTASFEISVIDDFELELGTEVQVEIPASMQMRYSFTVEETGYYQLNLGNSSVSYSLYLVEDGNTYYVNNSYNIFYLEEGCEYRLYLNNYYSSTDLETTLSVSPAIAFTLDADVYITYGRYNYILTVEESGWYMISTSFSSNCSVRYGADFEYATMGTSGGGWTDGNNYNYIRTYWLESGTEYFVSVYNNWDGEYTFRAEACPAAEALNLQLDSSTALVGSSVWCVVNFTPWYGFADVEVEIVSGDGEIVEQYGNQFYVQSNSVGTVEIKVTTASGLEATNSITFVEPEELNAGDQDTVSIPAGQQAYYSLKAESDGYYIVRLNSLEVSADFYQVYDIDYVDDEANGHRYYRLRVYSGNDSMVTLYNYAEEEKEIEIIFRAAEMPTGISIQGNEMAFSETYQSYGIDYGSYWAYTPVSWDVDGCGWISSWYEDKLGCYLETDGIFNVRAVCTENTDLTATLQVTVLDSIPVTVGEANEVTLPEDFQMRYSFTVDTDGMYSIELGNLVDYSLRLYRVDADGEKTRVYISNGVFSLEAGYTYWLYLTNYSAEVTTSLYIAPVVFTELSLGKQVMTQIESGKVAWFTFTPDSTGYYMLVRGSNAYVSVTDRDDNYYYGDTSTINGVRYTSYYMEAGVCYYISLEAYSTGYLDTVAMFVAPEAGNVISNVLSSTCVVGGRTYIHIELYPKYSVRNITWTVSDESIARIEYSGDYGAQIVGLAAGTVTVTAQAENGVSATVELRVIEPITVDMTGDQIETVQIPAGGAVRLNINSEHGYVLSYEDSIYMESANGAYTMWNEGMRYLYVTDDMVGDANVVLLRNLYNKAVVVTMLTEPLTKTNNISLNLTDVTVKMGDRYLLEAVFAPLTSWEYISWESSDRDIVMVDGWMNEAYFVGYGIGQSVITATTESGLSVSCTVTVEAPDISADLTLDEYVSGDGDYSFSAVYSFTAPKTGDYFFAVVSEMDTYITVRDSNWQNLTASDDYSGLNPGAWVSLSKGETVYISVYGYNETLYEQYRVIAASTDAVYNGVSDLYIVSQPRSVTVASGEMAQVSVLASGEGLTYKWYYSYNDKFYPTSAFTGPTYSIEMNSSRAGRQVYCVITDADGNSVQTQTVTLGLGTPLQILSQPQSVKVGYGQTATVKVEAVGEGLVYEWYFCDANSNTYNKTTSFKGNTYSVKMTESRANRRVFCLVSDKYGNVVETYTAVLYAGTELQITKQPVSSTTANGTVATVSVAALGDGLTYEWYYSSNGKFYKTDAFTGPTYSIKMNSSRAGREVYCVVTDAYGNSVTSDVATLYMGTTFAVTEQTHSVKVVNGETATVSVTATGAGLKYEWYYSDNGGKKFYKSDSFKSNTYSVKMTDARAGRQVYCVITNSKGCTIVTDIAVLYQVDIKITQRPESVMVANGETATVKVTAVGNDLRYAWYFSDDNGSSYSLTKSFTGNTYSVKMTDARAGRLVYCVITDADGNMVTTEVVTLRQLPIKIVTHPQDVSAAINAMATVTVEATGVGLTYEWYYSHNGTFYKTDAFTGPTYSIKMNAARDGRQVYCVITDINGYSVQTAVVTLSMIPIEITAQPQSVTVANGETATVTVKAEGNGLSYAWYYSYNGKFYQTDAFTGPTYSIKMNSSRAGRQVYCVITDADGNTVTTEIATLNME